jgi:ribosome assembly protein RRB1
MGDRTKRGKLKRVSDDPPQNFISAVLIHYIGAMDLDQDTFIPGRNKLSKGEILSPDPSTYHMLHTMGSTWPCLSIDVVRDNLGDNRTSYPMTLYAVAGTQTTLEKRKENQLMVMKLSGLDKMDNGESSSSDEESDDNEEHSDPILETKSIPLMRSTNRIRAHQTAQSQSSVPPKTLTASMQDDGDVLIHDITPHLTSFDVPGTVITETQNKPLCTIRAHKRVEGFALDWSPLHNEGRLITGDHSGKIFITTRTAGGGFMVDTTPYTGHDGSIEELQWSPSEKSVFASTGTDGTIKIWDTRNKRRQHELSVRASAVDVNVLSWSPRETYLLAHGDDAGAWGVWDLRTWKPNSASKPAVLDNVSPVADFHFHREQITCLEWHPQDNSVMLVGAGDSTLSLWDLSVEIDDEESRDTAGVRDVPPQLLFVHYMDEVKEGHWHPQIPGVVVATGGSGFG